MLLAKSASFRSSSWTVSASAFSASNASCVLPWPSDPRLPGACHGMGAFPLRAVALLLQGTCYYFSNMGVHGCLSPTGWPVPFTNCPQALTFPVPVWDRALLGALPPPFPSCGPFLCRLGDQMLICECGLVRSKLRNVLD